MAVEIQGWNYMNQIRRSPMYADGVPEPTVTIRVELVPAGEVSFPVFLAPAPSEPGLMAESQTVLPLGTSCLAPGLVLG